MNEQAYRNLSPAVRERLAGITDDQFATRPDVVAARKRVASANTAHESLSQAGSQLRLRRGQLDVFAETVRAKRREMHENRVRIMADALAVSGLDVEIAADSEVRDQIERFDLILEAMPIAMADLDAQQAAQARRVGDAANDCAYAEEALRDLLDRLKVAEAQRLAS